MFGRRIYVFVSSPGSSFSHDLSSHTIERNRPLPLESLHFRHRQPFCSATQSTFSTELHHHTILSIACSSLNFRLTPSPITARYPQLTIHHKFQASTFKSQHGCPPSYSSSGSKAPRRAPGDLGGHINSYEDCVATRR
jgi:hypothetical protein